MLGAIDLLVCGNSDPGTSCILSPFGKIEGLYFNNSKEPDDVMYNLKQDISRIMKEEGVEYIEIQCETKEDYYKIIDSLVDFNKDAITVSGVSKKEFNIIIESVEDIDAEEGEANAEPD